MLDDLEKYTDEPLSERELQEIRRIIEGDRNWRWLRTMLRHVGLWVGAVVGGMLIFRDAVRDFFRALFG